MDGRLRNIDFDSDSGADSDVPGSSESHHRMLTGAKPRAFDGMRSATVDAGEDAFGFHADGYRHSPPGKLETTFGTTISSITTQTVKGQSSAQRREKYVYGHSEDAKMVSNNAVGEVSLSSADNRRNMSTVSRAQASMTGQEKLLKHQRSKSDCSQPVYFNQATGDTLKNLEIVEDEVRVFCEPVSKKLICMLCSKVFKEPVITSCGHTFCNACVKSSTPSICPADGSRLAVVVANLAVSEQIGELYIRCKYGCSPLPGGEFEVSANGCPVTVKINSRSDHESVCQYAPTKCPNSSLCPPLLKMQLEDHLALCQHARCPHAKFNCRFEGTAEELDEHLKSCRFEAMKDFLEHTERQLEDLKSVINRKDQEADFMRGMIAKLTEKMERLEKNVEIRLDLLDENLTKLSSDFNETRRSLSHVEKEVLSMDSRVYNVGAFDVQSVLKCKGTFVGHQGPVWSLCVYSAFLFSGSSDNSIKVWDTRSNYKCVSTFTEHSGMVLALCAYRGKLYSGAADCRINIYDIESLKLLKNFVPHDNPVCTLAVGNGMLFSGSLKSIKVWELDSLKFIREFGGLNHWVRALVTTDNYLYCGSYQTIKIYDLQTLEPVRVLQTSGGSVYSLVVSREYIICGTYENSIHLWDLQNFKQVAVLTGHVGIVYDLVIMTFVDATRLISASYDRSLRVWSLDNMQCVQNMGRHQGSVTALAVSRGRLFSGSVDSTVKVWQ